MIYQAPAGENEADAIYCGSLGIFSANPLKHVSRSSSSFWKRQSVTAFAAGALGFGFGVKTAAWQFNRSFFSSSISRHPCNFAAMDWGFAAAAGGFAAAPFGFSRPTSFPPPDRRGP